MGSYRMTLRLRAWATGAVLGATVVAAPVHSARADNVSSTGKGIVGGAFLGAEAVTLVEAIAKVRSGLAFTVGGLLGAAAGGTGGYFVEKGSSDGRAPTYMLAGGLAFLIPAVIWTLDATRYLPEEGASEDRAPTAPAAEPGIPGANVTGAPNPPTDVAPPPPRSTPADAPPPPSTEPRAPPQSLLDLKTGRWRLGVPVPDVRPVYTVAERLQYGMRAETELRLPLLHVAF